jgi:hypothetical protein
MNVKLQREYRKVEDALRKAEQNGLIRFNWDYDPEPQLALDQDFETPTQERKYRADLESGAIEVLCCSVEVPRTTCPTCGRDWDDPAGTGDYVDRGWQDAPGMSSLGCIDLRVGDADSDAYRREIEHDLAAEAGVI